MNRSELAEANRLAWNEAAPRHERFLSTLIERFKKPGYNILGPLGTEAFTELGIKGKSVAQLCCNNGRELLSVRNLGADRCVGFDISEEFIKQAQLLTRTNNRDCEFVCADVHEIPAIYDGCFDIVFYSAGSLRWMPDLVPFFSVIVRLLKPNGWLLAQEIHPILDMFENERGGPSPKVCASYFRTKPFVQEGGLDYYGKTTYDSLPAYWFHHKLSDVIQAAIANGLRVTSFTEHEHDVSNAYRHLQKLKLKFPMSYTLVARREA